MTQPRIDGLDIHDTYQPVTDWAAATSHRMMTCKVTDGTGKPRPGGLAYFRQFREHNVPLRGMYHWLRSSSPMSAQVDRLGQAIDSLGGLQPGEFIQLDWETTPGIPNLTVAQVEEWLALVDGRWPDRTIVYGSDWVPGFTYWRLANPDRPVWYANYNTGDKPTGGWAECAKWDATVWQWSSTQMVPGIATRVDVNHVFDWSTLERIGHVDQPDVIVDPPVVVQPPDPPVVTKEPPVEGAKRTLFIPTDCDAQFLGWADGDGNALEIFWASKAVADAHRSVGVAVRDRLSLGGFSNCVLLGPLPEGDTRHTWTGAEFFRVVS